MDIDIEFEDFDRAVAEYRAEMAGAVQTLEEMFADRGLVFTLPFTGSIPNVAYGKLDDLFFYFKYRGDFAFLQLGAFDEELDAKERAEIAALMGPKRFGPELDDNDFVESRDPRKVLPNIIASVSSIEGYKGDPYCSDLTGAEAVEVFKCLVENLEPVENGEPNMEDSPYSVKGQANG